MRKFFPLLVAVLLIVGNMFPNIYIWGFDYHILKLPFQSDIQIVSNLVILFVGGYSLFLNKSNWFKYVYILIALFCMSYIGLYEGMYVYAFVTDAPISTEVTESLFNTILVQQLTYIFIIVYFLWSLKVVGLSRRELFILSLAIAIFSGISSHYVLSQ